MNRVTFIAFRFSPVADAAHSVSRARFRREFVLTELHCRLAPYPPQQFDHLSEVVEKCIAAGKQEEEDLGEIPDEFTGMMLSHVNQRPATKRRTSFSFSCVLAGNCSLCQHF